MKNPFEVFSKKGLSWTAFPYVCNTRRISFCAMRKSDSHMASV